MTVWPEVGGGEGKYRNAPVSRYLVCIEQHRQQPPWASAKGAYRKTMKLKTYSISPFSVNEQKGKQKITNIVATVSVTIAHLHKTLHSTANQKYCLNN